MLECFIKLPPYPDVKTFCLYNIYTKEGETISNVSYDELEVLRNKYPGSVSEQLSPGKEYKQESEKYYKELNKRMDVFKRDLFSRYNLDDRIGNLLFDLSYRYSENNRYNELEKFMSYFRDLCKLYIDIIEDN